MDARLGEKSQQFNQDMQRSQSGHIDLTTQTGSRSSLDAPMKPTDLVLRLPEDVLFNVLEYIDFKTKLSMMRVNSDWGALMRLPNPWRRLDLASNRRSWKTYGLSPKYLPGICNAAGRGQGKITHVYLHYCNPFNDTEHPLLLDQLLMSNARNLKMFRSEAQIAGSRLFLRLPWLTNLRCPRLLGHSTETSRDDPPTLPDLELPPLPAELVFHDRSLPGSISQCQPSKLAKLDLKIIEAEVGEYLNLGLLESFCNSLEHLTLENLDMDREIDEIRLTRNAGLEKQIHLSDFDKLTHLNLIDCDLNLLGRLPTNLQTLNLRKCGLTVDMLTEWLTSDIGNLQEVSMNNALGVTWPWLRYFLVHGTKAWETATGVAKTMPRKLPCNLTSLTAIRLVDPDEPSLETHANEILPTILQVHGQTLRIISVHDDELDDICLEEAVGSCQFITSFRVVASRIQISTAWLLYLSLQQTLEVFSVGSLDCSSYSGQEAEIDELHDLCHSNGVNASFSAYRA